MLWVTMSHRAFCLHTLARRVEVRHIQPMKTKPNANIDTHLFSRARQSFLCQLLALHHRRRLRRQSRRRGELAVPAKLTPRRPRESRIDRDSPFHQFGRAPLWHLRILLLLSESGHQDSTKGSVMMSSIRAVVRCDSEGRTRQ